MGRGRGRRHEKKSVEVTEDGEAVVQFDFGFHGRRYYLAAVCTTTNLVNARYVTKKGATKDAVDLVVKMLRHLGHVKVCLQSDAEPGLVELLVATQAAICGQDAVGNTRQVRVRTTGGNSFQSNGAVENAVERIELS